MIRWRYYQTQILAGLAAGILLGALLFVHQLIYSTPPPDPVIHHLIQPNPPIRSLYPENPTYEVRLLKLHLVRPDLILYPLDTRYFA